MIYQNKQLEPNSPTPHRELRDWPLARPQGMTLIELLVVIVILSILSSLSLAGLSVARTNAKRARTETTIRKISEIILPYYEQYETRRPNITNLSSLASSSRSAVTDAKQLAIRRLMTLELPERLCDVTDAFSNGSLTPIAATKTYNNVIVSFPEMPPVTRRYYQAITSLSNPIVTSAEMLHLIITRGPVADPDIIAHFRDDETADTDGDGLLEFIDGWRRPIMFLRWATGFNSPVQPIDDNVRNIDTTISDEGHRLVPLVFSAGLDGAYDIEAMPQQHYLNFDYDPFRFDASSPASSPINCDPASTHTSVRGEGLLTPARVSPLTFSWQRFIGTPINGSFQTVGSERDTGSPDGISPNGTLESLDNIHNHDMTR